VPDAKVTIENERTAVHHHLAFARESVGVVERLIGAWRLSRAVAHAE
jgi:hypothetical protein